MTQSLCLQPLGDTCAETDPLDLVTLPCTVGRSRDCDLQLNLDRISRHHLRLRLDGEQLLVEDLGSTNGTFVNDERIHVPTLLQPGDTLHIADYTFRLTSSDDSDGTPAARSGKPDTLSGQTIAGFTEESIGFPVQAPQFYELLNDALIEPLAAEADTNGQGDDALLILGRSRHPGLSADHDKLVEMARQLGEETRYHALLRQLAAQAGDQAGIDHRLIILPSDPIETEDIDLLIDELGNLSNKYRRLQLACLLDITPFDRPKLERLIDRLDRLGVATAARADAMASDADRDTADLDIIPVSIPAQLAATPLSELD